MAGKALPLLLPVALLVLLVAGLTLADPARLLGSNAPPPEEIAFERVTLTETGIVARVRNAVGAEVAIAQVMVDDAFWEFTADPGVALGPFGATTLTIPYPWVEGEPHVIAVLTNSGLVWEHEIAVATLTPAPAPRAFADYALIGLLVGFLPVAAGMAFYPSMRDAPARWTNALLAFTLGLLAFLAVDTVGEGLELAEELPGSYQGLGLFAGAALVALVAVLALERGLSRKGHAPALALLIALGIGLHNLGEGLLIGSAFSLGSLALGTALIVGFAVHNVTEGPAIVAPLAVAARRAGGSWLPWGRFLLLAAVAGVPTVFGAWLGAFASSSVLPVVFFGLGSGAILVVLVQVGLAMRRDGESVFTPLHMLAFVLGYAVMLATSLLTA
ncbi:MAG TPA: metal transporter [Candidatus Thermoplasmatota archaeon]|nr:metal transporter [Candidatus Thermoplasmatota archaeon]